MPNLTFFRNFPQIVSKVNESLEGLYNLYCNAIVRKQIQQIEKEFSGGYVGDLPRSNSMNLPEEPSGLEILMPTGSNRYPSIDSLDTYGEIIDNIDKIESRRSSDRIAEYIEEKMAEPNINSLEKPRKHEFIRDTVGSFLGFFSRGDGKKVDVSKSDSSDSDSMQSKHSNIYVTSPTSSTQASSVKSPIRSPVKSPVKSPVPMSEEGRGSKLLKTLRRISSFEWDGTFADYSPTQKSRTERKSIDDPKVPWYLGVEKEYDGYMRTISKYLPYIKKECFKAESSCEICIKQGSVLIMIRSLPCIPFEERKIIDKIIHRCLRFGEAFEQIEQCPDDICGTLLKYYADEELVGIASPILQKLIQSDVLLEKFTNWENIKQLLQYMKDPDFDLLANSSSTLCLILTISSNVVENFFKFHFNDFFDDFMQAIATAEHTLIRAWYLRILYKILTIRRNMKVLVEFVSREEYLRIIMNCMLEKSPNVYVNAMEVFSLFVFCPKKTQNVQSILVRNKIRLVSLFSKRSKDNLSDLPVRLLEALETI